MHVPCPPRALDYLSQKDKKMAAAIARIGVVRRARNPDAFSALIFAIIGQQISATAAKTVRDRLQNLCPVAPNDLLRAGAPALQSVGIGPKKTAWILEIAQRARDGRLDLDGLDKQDDAELIKTLTALPGVGVWSAQMLMIFSLGRMNVLSYNDFAILRGLRALYRHKRIDRRLFAKYQKRYAPYGTVASLYLWEIANGALGLDDPAKNQNGAPARAVKKTP